MDANRFDNMSRQIGEQSDRRQMLKTAAGGTMALLGMGALSRAVLAQDVEAEAGYDGQKCKQDSNCKKGLTCKIATGKDRGRCRYKRGCGGKNKDACKKDQDCCGGFECRKKKCRRK